MHSLSPFVVIAQEQVRLLHFLDAQVQTWSRHAGQRIVEIVILPKVPGMEVIVNRLRVNGVLRRGLRFELPGKNKLARVVVRLLAVERAIGSVQRVSEAAERAVLRSILLEISAAGV